MSIWNNPENVRLLETWVARGCSARQIAERFVACGEYVTRNGVIGKCHRLGLALGGEGAAVPPPPKGPEAPPEAPEMAASPKRKRVPPARAIAVTPPAPPPVDDVPETVTPALEVSAAALTLIAARADQCRYPVAGAGAGLLVCGAPVAPGRVYCRHHHILAHQPPRPPVSLPRDGTSVRARREEGERDVFEVMGEAA